MSNKSRQGRKRVMQHAVPVSNDPTKAQYIVQLAVTIRFNPKGKGQDSEPEVFSTHVYGCELNAYAGNHPQANERLEKNAGEIVIGTLKTALANATVKPDQTFGTGLDPDAIDSAILKAEGVALPRERFIASLNAASGMQVEVDEHGNLPGTDPESEPS